MNLDEPALISMAVPKIIYIIEELHVQAIQLSIKTEKNTSHRYVKHVSNGRSTLLFTQRVL
jgi:hypothetical protein